MSSLPDSLPSWTLEFAGGPEAGGCDLVRQWLREHNWRENGPFMEKLHQPEHEAQPLVVLAQHEGQVVGGLMAETQLSWLRIAIMAVDPAHRCRGMGTALLAAAEREASARGCLYASVDTMEHQAPSFYRKHGYVESGMMLDWDSHGHAKFWFSKVLAAPPGQGAGTQSN